MHNKSQKVGNTIEWMIFCFVRLGNGLLISSGDHWRSHRKLIAPAFHQNVLKSFIGTFNSNSLNVVKRMEKELGKEFDCHDYMSETTVDILLGKHIFLYFAFCA